MSNRRKFMHSGRASLLSTASARRRRISRLCCGTALTSLVGLLVGISPSTAADIIVNGATTPGDGGAINSVAAVMATTVDNISLTNNSAGGMGGAINSGSTVTLDAGGMLTLTGNIAGTNGGATASGGATMLTGSTITLSNNSAGGMAGAVGGVGGGIFSTGAVTITGPLTMNSNQAGEGGGVAVLSGDIIVNGSVSADSNVVRGGVDVAGGSASGIGGAFAAFGGNVNLATAAGNGNVSLTNNSAQGIPASFGGGGGNGGAVYASGNVAIGNAGGTVTIGGAGAGNTATGAGGAIWSGGTTTLAGSTITLSNNMAGSSGGGILSTGTVTIAGAMTANSNAALEGSGGAIWSMGNVSVTGSLSATGDTARGTAATSPWGGAVYSTANVIVTGNVTLVGNSTSANIGNNNPGVYTVAAGGGIAASNVTINGNLVATDNTVSSTGGIVVPGNQAASSNSIAFGGAIAALHFTSTGSTQAGNVTVNGSVTMTGNQAIPVNGNASFPSVGGQGGAIYANNVALATGAGQGNVILDQNAASSSGGVIQAAGIVNIGNAGGTVEIVDNNACTLGPSCGGTTGGAISTLGNGAGFGVPGVTLTGTQVTLSDNVAGQLGGGIFSSQGGVTVNGPLTADDNRVVTGSGGAIYSSGGAVTVTGAADMEGNTASTGGAIYSLGNVNLAAGSGNTTLSSNAVSTGSGGAVFASGNVAIGDPVNNPSGTVTISGNSAGVDGGAIATTGGSVSIIGTGSISSNSAGGNGGAIATGSTAAGNVTLEANGGDIAVTGNKAGGNGGAIYLNQGALDLEATVGNISFSGNTEGTSSSTPQVNAIYLNNASGTTTATFNAAAGNTITFFDPIQNNAANGLITVTKTGNGTVAFDGSLYTTPADRLSPVYANTTVQGGTFAVDNNAVYGVLAADVGQTAPTSFTVDSGTTLAGGVAGTVQADAFTLNGALDIAGMRPGTIGNNFTVVSNAVSFGAGSQVLFNTTLNDGSVQQTDLLTLTLNGTATSGTAGVRVTNVGGAGAVTVGNGIELVQVTNNNGATAGAFNLVAPVVAGPYEYDLFHGSVDVSGPQNWYLRSTLNCSLEPNAEVCPQPPTPPTPPTPGPPHFRIETSLDAALPAIALLYGRSLMDTLHERVGDEEDIRGLTGLYQNAPYTGGWARLIGTGGNEQGDPRGIFGSGPEFSYGFLGLQGGQDLIRYEHDDGSRDHAGVTFAVGSAHSNVTHFDGTIGDDDFQAYTLGGYWTHFGVPGWYVDTMLQGTFYDARTSANRGLLPFKTDGGGIAGSVEAGYPFKFGGGYFIEPQAQLMYQNINFNDALDNAALVKFSNVDSLIGRVGARFGRTWSLDGNVPDARLITVWIRPNIWQEFRGNPTTQFSSEDGFVPFRSDLSGTWGEINVGVSGQLNLNTTLFANASYQERFDGKGFAYDGKAGVRVNW